jgi:tellurite resistance protein TerC
VQRLGFMAKALALVDRHHLFNNIQDGLRYTFDAAFTKDNGYTLFRWEDWPAWVIFTSVFMTLIIFDNVILHRNPEALTVTRACLYTLFWMCAAGGFSVWVAWWYGTNAAYMWGSGYMLEWMLSFDNLFVFHLIFSVYCCPDTQKHRPLYLGIMGAVIFRLIFIFVGEYLMHAMSFMHLVFGAFLVYTGLKTVASDEEDEDPSQQPLVLWLQHYMSFVSVYAKDASFFVRVPINEQGEADIPESAYVKEEASETDRLLESDEPEKTIPIVDFSLCSNLSQRYETRATMLFLVVCCLEISDILFAVDSVSAIVAQVNDLFLAYTSCVFAMLGLRATFFIIDVLVQLFSLLKYGVAIVLVFVGIKLMINKYYHIPPMIVCAVLVSAIAGSMVASVIQEKLQAKFEGKMSPEIAERVAKIKNSPFASPQVIKKLPA